MTITRDHIKQAREKFDPNDEEPYSVYFVPDSPSDVPIRDVQDIADWTPGTRGLLSVPPLVLELQLILHDDDDEDFVWHVVQTLGDLLDSEDAETLYLVYMPTKKGDEWQQIPKEMDLEAVVKLMAKWGFD